MVSPNGLPIVYVCRPSEWGNRYVVAKGKMRKFLNWKSYKFLVATPAEAVQKFSEFDAFVQTDRGRAYVREKLKGKNLACWCKLSQPCHADILLEIANMKGGDI